MILCFSAKIRQTLLGEHCSLI